MNKIRGEPKLSTPIRGDLIAKSYSAEIEEAEAS